MSTKEQIVSLLDSVPEYDLRSVLILVQGLAMPNDGYIEQALDEADYEAAHTDKRLTHDCEKLLEDRKPYIYKVGERRIQIAEEQEKLHAAVCAPINVDGDIIGSIIILIDDMGAQPSESDIKLVTTSAQLLAKQLEA